MVGHISLCYPSDGAQLRDEKFKVSEHANDVELKYFEPYSRLIIGTLRWPMIGPMDFLVSAIGLFPSLNALSHKPTG